jgi:hypothetical protein
MRPWNTSTDAAFWVTVSWPLGRSPTVSRGQFPFWIEIRTQIDVIVRPVHKLVPISAHMGIVGRERTQDPLKPPLDGRVRVTHDRLAKVFDTVKHVVSDHLLRLDAIDGIVHCLLKQPLNTSQRVPKCV